MPDMMSYFQLVLVGCGAIFILYLIAQKMGWIKGDAYKKQIQREAEVGWGKINLEKITRDELKQKIRFAPKSKQSFYIGMFKKYGKVRRSFKLLDGRLCYVYMSPFESMPFLAFLGLVREFFYVGNEDIIIDDNKSLRIKEGEPISFGSVFTMMSSDAEEMKKRKLLLENFSFKATYEDLLGRTENFARSAIYLNLSHAENADLAVKRAEAWGAGTGGFPKPKSFLGD